MEGMEDAAAVAEEEKERLERDDGAGSCSVVRCQSDQRTAADILLKREGRGCLEGGKNACGCP